jgi:hypothetical protein
MNELRMEFEMTQFESDIPYISAIVVNYKDILVTTDLEKNVEFYDLKNGEKIYEFKIEKMERLDDGLLLLEHYGEKHLLLADRGRVYLYRHRKMALSMESFFELEGKSKISRHETVHIRRSLY